MSDTPDTAAPMQRAMIPIVISHEPSGRHFVVTQGDRSADGLGWGEMIEQVVELTHPKIEHAHYPMLTAAERRVYEAQRDLRQAERMLQEEREQAAREIPF